MFHSILVTCEALILPNGEVSYNASAVDGRYIMYTNASFTCNSGYSVNGFQFSICQTMGTWNPQTPTCIGKKHEWYFLYHSNSVSIYELLITGGW